MFVHAGWLHVVSNLLCLWIFGDNVEARHRARPLPGLLSAGRRGGGRGCRSGPTRTRRFRWSAPAARSPASWARTSFMFPHSRIHVLIFFLFSSSTSSRSRPSSSWALVCRCRSSAAWAGRDSAAGGSRSGPTWAGSSTGAAGVFAVPAPRARTSRLVGRADDGRRQRTTVTALR